MSLLPLNDLQGQRFAKPIAFILSAFLITGTLVCNHWFISPTQTPLFLYTLFASLFIGICGILVCIQGRNTSLRLPVPVFLFVLYVFLHALFASTGINSSHIYLIISCLFFIAWVSLPVLLAGEGLFKIIAITAGIVSLICILQYAGILPSQNIYFKVTGTWTNPNVTAIFLAMSVPVFFYFLFCGHSLYKQIARPLALLVLVALLLLQCRTAWLGALVVTVLLLNHPYQLWQRFKKQSNLFVKSLLALTVIAVLLSAAVYAYRLKQDSADGRMLVWKLCLQMIAQRPLTGYGYGNFEQAYNIHQAAYFKNGHGTRQEKYQADYVRMAYNEPLQNAVEGGGLGLLLFLALLIPLLIPPTTDTSKTDTENKYPPAMAMTVYTGVVAFAVMSLVNFTIQAIPGLCLFIMYAAISCQAKPARQFPINKNLAGGVLIMAGLYFFITQTSTASAQWQNHQAAIALQKRHYQKAGRLLQTLSARLSTSDSYWLNYGQLLLEQEKYRSAVSLFNKAKEFTSNPAVYLQTGYCFEQTDEITRAEREYDTAACMQPNRLTPRHALLQLFLITKDTAAALKQAKEMIAIREKTPSPKATQFKKEADSVISLFSTQVNNNITQSQIQ